MIPGLGQTTVGGLQVLDAVEALRALGVDVESLCREVALSPTLLAEPTARVSLAQVVDLFAGAQRRTGDPLVGLHAGARAEPRSALMYLLLSSARLGQGLAAWRRFGALIADGLRIDVEVRDEMARLSFSMPALAATRLRHPVEYLLVKCVRALRRAVGPGVRVQAVHLPHAPGGSIVEATRIFGCPVSWESSECCVVLPAGGLEQAPQLANPEIAAQVESLAASLTPGAGATLRLRDQVAEATRELLVAGRRADQATIVARLHLTPRTLQRRLGDEGTTFKEVRDRALWQAVEALLANPSLTLEAVASSVGFSDLPAFSKAFKRRAGCSPARWRRERVDRQGLDA